jgi:hypothetical protein
MRRPSRYGLVAGAVFLALLGSYTAYWVIVAHRIESGIAAWAHSSAQQNIDAAARRFGVTGFPTGFRVELQDAVLRDRSIAPAPELRLPTMSGSARPWDLKDWRLRAPQGLSADLAGTGGRPPVRLAARTADGTISFARTRGTTLWLRLEKASAEGGGSARIDAADLWITMPAQRPQKHTDANFGVAADLRSMQLPAAAGALGDSIDELAFGLTVNGPLASGSLVQALAAWRDAGGTIALDNLDLQWGGLGASATGTIALDSDLQPIGGFSGAIEGYERILQALVQAGRMRPGDAGLARLALTMLAKAGPDGRPEIATSFTIQDGQMYLGPARLGPAPRLAWK